MTYLGTQCKDKLLECFILLQQLSPRNLIEKASLLIVERQKSSEVRVISIFSAWLSLNGAMFRGGGGVRCDNCIPTCSG